MENKSKLYFLNQFPTDELYNEFKVHPNTNKKNIKCFQAISDHELLVTYNDNHRELYNELNNWLYIYVPYESDALTEEQHRIEFRKILKNKLLMSGMTQKELADKLNVSRQMVSKYIAGTALPGYTVLKKLADIFNCTVNDLYLIF